MKYIKSIIIRNAEDNPALLASGIKKGDIGMLIEWHKNLCCGMAMFSINNRIIKLPITDKNIL